MSDSGSVEQLAALGKAYGDVLRLNILRVLSTDSFGVLELSGIFDMRQPAMSHHLKVLAQAGLVSTRKEGNTIFYRRSLPTAEGVSSDLLRSLFAAVDSLEVSKALSDRVQQVRSQRAEQSMAFFARNINQFRQHQELIADHELYARCVADVLEKTELPTQVLAMELGPGEGEFLDTLSSRFQRVYAVDNSSEMLAISQQRVQSKGLHNVQFVHGEIDTLNELNEQFDCIVANMVLHHVASPFGIFSWVSRLLKPGGSLLVSELSSHDQDWVKESCGDLWLGFSVEELDGWAQETGLQIGESQFLGLRNGFQIQVRRFYKPTT